MLLVVFASVYPIIYAHWSMASIHPVSWTTTAGEQRKAWRVSYWVGGKKRFKQFPTERKARRFTEGLSSVKESALRLAGVGKGPTVAEIADRWLAACQRGRNGAPPLEPETVHWYAGHVANYIKPALGAVRVRALTREAVQDFREGLLGGRLSRNTAKKILVSLKTLVGFALEEGELHADPTHRVAIRLSGRDRARIEMHTKSEMSAILAAADRLAASHDRRVSRTWERYVPLLHLLVYAGLRLSEARGLKRDAVDVAMQEIRVFQRADKRGRIGAPKTAHGTRRIHIPDDTAERLKVWLERHRHPLVFATALGRPLDGNNIRKRLWHVVCAAAEVRELTLHSCRHFFASRQIELGRNLKELCVLMGHADEAFTLRVYGHLFRDKGTEARSRALANASILDMA